MNRRRLGLLFIGLLACNANGPTKEDCATRVAAMRALFAQAPADPTIFLQPPAGLALPTTSRGEPHGDGLPIFVHADGRAEFDAQPYPSLAAVQGTLTAELETGRTLSERMGKPFAPVVQLVADARAPLPVLVGFAEALPPEVKLQLLAELAGDTVPPPPPTPPAVRDALAAPAREVSFRLAEVLAPALGTCAPAKQTFEAVATAPFDQRTRILVDGLTAAVETCRCEGLDLDTVVAGVWTMIGKTAPARRTLALAPSRDPAVELAPLPADATVADLVEFLETRGAAPFRLAPAPATP